MSTTDVVCKFFFLVFDYKLTLSCRRSRILWLVAKTIYIFVMLAVLWVVCWSFLCLLFTSVFKKGNLIACRSSHFLLKTATFCFYIYFSMGLLLRFDHQNAIVSWLRWLQFFYYLFVLFCFAFFFVYIFWQFFCFFCALFLCFYVRFWHLFLRSYCCFNLFRICYVLNSHGNSNLQSGSCSLFQVFNIYKQTA